MLYTHIYPTPKSEHYLNRYISFILGINNPVELTTEEHHILPESMGGENHSNNLINLTPRQHYVAHWMLWKAYRSKEMSFAFFSMCNQNNPYQHRNYRINSKVYEKLRLEFINAISESSTELWKDPEYRKKHQETNKTEYTRNLRSEKAKELWENIEYRDKLILARKAVWADGRFVRDHSKCGVKGERNPAKRLEVRAKNSGANHYSNREGYTKPSCPHCGLISTPTNIKRWHGNNCKSIRN